MTKMCADKKQKSWISSEEFASGGAVGFHLNPQPQRSLFLSLSVKLAP